MSTAKKVVLRVLIALLIAILVGISIFVGVFFTRFTTMSSIKKVSNYDDEYDLYTMRVNYNYDLDKIIEMDLDNDEDIFNTIAKESLLLPIKVKTPSFGCTAFSLLGADGKYRMGRNYDFSLDTSAMLVYCQPEDGYKSVAFAALDNVSANHADSDIKQKMASLTAPFICLDGMNEKGVSIAVLVVDSQPVRQNTEKHNIFTTLAIRLVLDRAASTAEAVELLKNYDMHATSGKDYHFYVTDANGDGRIIEYDCESATRELVATPVNVATNFYTLYADKVLPNQRNGIYGHGKERYDSVINVLEAQNSAHTNNTAWDALKASSQTAGAELTSNTQWSIVFNNTDLTVQFVLRRNWNDVYVYSLKDNSINKL